MDVLREREVKGSLERQLVDAQKLRGKWCFFLYAHMYVYIIRSVQTTWNLVLRLYYLHEYYGSAVFCFLKHFHWNKPCAGGVWLLSIPTNSLRVVKTKKKKQKTRRIVLMNNKFEYPV